MVTCLHRKIEISIALLWILDERLTFNSVGRASVADARDRFENTSCLKHLSRLLDAHAIPISRIRPILPNHSERHSRSDDAPGQ